jgi:hypothetical protein
VIAVIVTTKLVLGYKMSGMGDALSVRGGGGGGWDWEPPPLPQEARSSERLSANRNPRHEAKREQKRGYIGRIH